ncbi:glucan biosynthesis protein, partial [Cupriavidus sp. 2MCAB6]
AWRPLNNPSRTTASSFVDNNPRGFGLMQRDREVGHYLDGVFYERRPSLWIETIGQWGKGAVQLIEIPTDDEIHDNIVAMWVPEGPAKAGAAYEFHYKLHWLADEPFPSPLGRVVATRLGNGGQPGT